MKKSKSFNKSKGVKIKLYTNLVNLSLLILAMMGFSLLLTQTQRLEALLLAIFSVTKIYTPNNKALLFRVYAEIALILYKYILLFVILAVLYW